jgi:8-oxo-dGTP diphosphatase
MSRCEKAIVTVLCTVYDGNKILLQDSVKEDWRGLTFPGGYVEREESFKGNTHADIKCDMARMFLCC